MIKDESLPRLRSACVPLLKVQALLHRGRFFDLHEARHESILQNSGTVGDGVRSLEVESRFSGASCLPLTSCVTINSSN